MSDTTALKLETDQFCRCGYNLHGQRVWMDERLGFAICRCPECGTHHPAGHGVTAASLWLNRMSTLYVGGYALAVLISGILWTLVVGGTAGALVSEIGPDWDAFAGAASPLILMIVVGSVLMGLLLPVVFFRVGLVGRMLSILTVSALPAAFAWLVNSGSPKWKAPGSLFTAVAAIWAGIAGLMIITSFVGRPVARFLLLRMLTDRAARALGFLWTVDGLEPPGVVPMEVTRPVRPSIPAPARHEAGTDA